MMMSLPPSRAQSDVFSASQYGADPVITQPPPPKQTINYFIIPVFILEIIGLACLWAFFYYLRFTDVFPYHRRTFYCRDRELMKPDFVPDDFILYVSPAVLYSVSFVLPPVFIFAGEVMFWLFSSKPRKTVYAGCRECKVHLFTRRLLRFVSVFMFGALIVCIFIDSIKLITGYQRPYFLTACRLNTSTTAGFCAPPNEVAPDRNPRAACMNPSDDELRTAWLTFPSLYAGLSSFAACFTSLYIHYMINLRGAPLLRPSLIAGLVGMALVASFSRIQGYKNHWVDIWVGWLIGVAAAYYLCYNVLAFQEHYLIHAAAAEQDTTAVITEERVPPFFQWFKLPRIPTVPKETYSVYTNDDSPVLATPRQRQKRDTNRIYEVTTTTESFQRTINPQHTSNGIDY